jgi:hypothetical protein
MNLTAFRAEGIKARSTGAETIYPPIRVGLGGEASSLDGLALICAYLFGDFGVVAQHLVQRFDE